MSSFVITIVGSAPAISVLLILEPVTTTFCRVTTSSSSEVVTGAGTSSEEESSLDVSVSTVSSTATGSSTTSSPGLSANTFNVIVNAKNKVKNSLLFISFPRKNAQF